MEGLLYEKVSEEACLCLGMQVMLLSAAQNTYELCMSASAGRCHFEMVRVLLHK